MSHFGHDDPTLTAALRVLAEDDAKGGPSPEVLARLLAEVRALRLARRRRQRFAALAVAATLVATIGLATWTVRTPSAPATAATPAAAAGEVTTEFLPLLYSNVPASNGQLVRLELPRTALAAFGLGNIDSIASTPAATVLADVIVGEDGLARAVRFVRAAGPHKERP